MAKVTIDTNILIDNCNVIDKYESIVLPIAILEELDNLKSSDGELGFKARNTIKKLEKATNIKYQCNDIYSTPEGWDSDKRDNKIIMCAKENNCKLISNDVNVRIKARSIGVECESCQVIEKDVDYKGWREIILNDYELAMYYSNIHDFNLRLITEYKPLDNEYIIIKNNIGTFIKTYKYKKGHLKSVKDMAINNNMYGDILPKDIFQQFAINSLYEDQFSILVGHAGTGKSLLSLAYCMGALEEGKYEKIIIAFNPIKARGSTDLGFYSGSKDEKAMQNSIGNMLTSKFSDQRAYIEAMIGKRQIELVPIADIRGMEILDNQILYITEAQNLSVDLCKLCIQRASEKTKVILEGDIDTQVDSHCFQGRNNGLRKAIDVFSGEAIFSMVQLPNIYRSKLAGIADKM